MVFVETISQRGKIMCIWSIWPVCCGWGIISNTQWRKKRTTNKHIIVSSLRYHMGTTLIHSSTIALMPVWLPVPKSGASWPWSENGNQEPKQSNPFCHYAKIFCHSKSTFLCWICYFQILSLFVPWLSILQWGFIE